MSYLHPILLLTLIISACATRVPIEDLNLPLVVDAKFGICNRLDGADTVEYWSKEVYGGKVEIEWVSELPENITFQGVSPIGQPIFQLRYDGNSRSFTGTNNLHELVSELEVNSGDYLEVNGEYIPLKITEVPCLLAGKFPKIWLRNVSSKELKGRQYHLKISESDREIDLTSNVVSGKLANDCSIISWRRFLFFKYSIKLCLLNEFGGELQFEDKLKLKWQRLE